jgi:hypothetical protein
VAIQTLWPAHTATSSKDRWIGGLFYFDTLDICGSKEVNGINI